MDQINSDLERLEQVVADANIVIDKNRELLIREINRYVPEMLDLPVLYPKIKTIFEAERASLNTMLNCWNNFNLLTAQRIMDKFRREGLQVITEKFANNDAALISNKFVQLLVSDAYKELKACIETFDIFIARNRGLAERFQTKLRRDLYTLIKSELLEAINNMKDSIQITWKYTAIETLWSQISHFIESKAKHGYWNELYNFADEEYKKRIKDLYILTEIRNKAIYALSINETLNFSADRDEFKEADLYNGVLEELETLKCNIVQRIKDARIRDQTFNSI